MQDRGVCMMRAMLGLLTLAGLGAAQPAEAATVVILTDPMTLERRTMVLDDKGPDRVLLCTMPPATSGCRELTPRRR
jgi:hypothetical protein